MASHDDEVTHDERRKAQYLAEYEALCLKHGMMVVVIEKVQEDWQNGSDSEEVDEVHALFDLAAAPESLDIVLEEMRIGDVCYFRDDSGGPAI